jgi:hypothetical protein
MFWKVKLNSSCPLFAGRKFSIVALGQSTCAPSIVLVLVAIFSCTIVPPYGVLTFFFVVRCFPLLTLVTRAVLVITQNPFRSLGGFILAFRKIAPNALFAKLPLRTGHRGCRQFAGIPTCRAFKCSFEWTMNHTARIKHWIRRIVTHSP